MHHFRVYINDQIRGPTHWPSKSPVPRILSVVHFCQLANWVYDALVSRISWYSDTVILHILLENGKFPADDVLRRAVVHNNVSATRAAIQYADINHNDGLCIRTAVWCMVVYPQSEITDILIAAGADVNLTNKQHDSAIYSALERNTVKTVAKLLAAGAALPSNWKYLVHDAVDQDEKETLIQEFITIQKTGKGCAGHV